jgi:hypothetical protein
MSGPVPLHKLVNFSKSLCAALTCLNLFAEKHVGYYVTILQMAIYT